eukprot:m.111365 g.111365  ORF g.111365 m.111365 type:complete len:65 (-) comp15294_c2_seq1:1322-1516(-)
MTLSLSVLFLDIGPSVFYPSPLFMFPFSPFLFFPFISTSRRCLFSCSAQLFWFNRRTTAIHTAA